MTKIIVITGSTRGIGYGMADAFLARGHSVVVSGRNQNSVDKALASLLKNHPADHILGHPCEVTDLTQNESLWEAAKNGFGQIDIWINNAGIGHPLINVWEMPKEMLDSVVNINLIGVMYGSRVAVKGMIEQGFGHVYNMEGFGSTGQFRPGLSVYGTTKYALAYLTKALAKETEKTPVKVSALSPGIVTTDFLSEQYEHDPEGYKRAQRIFNILGDKPETVTPWLVDKILANEKSGARIAWLTSALVTWRFMTAGFNKRNLFEE